MQGCVILTHKETQPIDKSATGTNNGNNGDGCLNIRVRFYVLYIHMER
jgi:hypothetical protein